jgi:hypothetical protein
MERREQNSRRDQDGVEACGDRRGLEPQRIAVDRRDEEAAAYA